MPSLQVLLVEDNPDDAELMVRQLLQGGYELQYTRVQTRVDFLAELKRVPDIIISDYAMPQFSGLEALHLLRESGLDIPLILVSGTVGEEIAVEAMHHGATDYLLKDRVARLQSAVERALKEKQLRAERNLAEQKVQAQLRELRRWQSVTLGREDRVQALKREVNALLCEAGQPPRYPSSETGDEPLA